MKPRKQNDIRSEVSQKIALIIAHDILPLLVDADLHHLTIDNDINDVFGTGLSININTVIHVSPLSPGDMGDIH